MAFWAISIFATLSISPHMEFEPSTTSIVSARTDTLINSMLTMAAKRFKRWVPILRATVTLCEQRFLRWNFGSQ